ncbi:MAG: class I SAM-dependent methyltransferase [Chlorobi bacterium]|nr:class I SAM-dependent methyltransferase [Chlorobiota bacterium]MCI0716604.1 class I SAM-dependent methyltransferase [Chlorobiota bacterium]
MNTLNRIKSQYKQVNRVYYLDESKPDFEDIYIKLRSAEGRVYSDSEVKPLPDISPNHKHYKEWQVRKKSSEMLVDYIRQKENHKSILDLGSGNGWLTHKLGEINQFEVIGMDVNITELEQAARVFNDKPNLAFVCGDIFKLELKFDYIILASVIAYFNDLKKLISALLNNLNSGGEIHIIDSPFYNDTAKAKRNSEIYYNQIGFPEMAKHYNHHSLDALKEFNYSILYNPNSALNKFKRFFKPSLLPFYWVRVEGF